MPYQILENQCIFNQSVTSPLLFSALPFLLGQSINNHINQCLPHYLP